MPCLFALFAGMFPRIADIFIWIARPTMFMNAFNDRWLLASPGNYLSAVHHADVGDHVVGWRPRSRF